MASSPNDVSGIKAASDPQSIFNRALRDLDDRLKQGEPFSGHERKCLYLNTGTQRWANVSHVSGFDTDDDGRALAATDWDGDGDVDVWMSNRTAPMVRFFRNDTPRAGGFLTLKLRQDTGNTGAIGARVEIRLKGKPSAPLIREVRAGDGFLAQSSLRLHFGLGKAAEIAEVRVRWPGGKVELFTGVTPDAAWLLQMGTGRAESLERKPPASALQPGKVTVPPGEFPAAVHLSHTIPLPPIGYTDTAGTAKVLSSLKGSPVLLNFCSGDLEPCAKQIEIWTAQLPAIRAAGLRLFIAGMDTSEATRKLLNGLPAEIERGFLTAHARERLAYLYNLPFEIELQFTAPSSMLLDGNLRLLTLYRGPAAAGQIIEGAARAGFTPAEIMTSSMPFSGLWFQVPAPWAPLELFTTILLQGDWDAAHEYMMANRAEFSKSRRHPGAAKVLADALIAQDRPAQALPHYQDALRDYSGDPALLNNLAHCLLHSQPKPDAAAVAEALTRAAEAVKLTGETNASLLDTLARAFLASGQKAAAAAAVRKGLNLKGNPPGIIKGLEEILAEAAE